MTNKGIKLEYLNKLLKAEQAKLSKVNRGRGYANISDNVHKIWIAIKAVERGC